MRSYNQSAYKEKIAPEWYLDGPVKIYTPEEIAEWEKTRDPRMDAKIAMQSGLSEADIIVLDNLNVVNTEIEFQALMESGIIEANDNYGN